ncbi:MAG: hypothetical protein HYZ00_11100, partial [Candidatus Hydrogenedentes bacterium]|nr:hypothetical protein [Candidatus Hydrogenedentota bacterium]
ALTGGAIYCDADSTLTAEHCTFIDNFAAGAYPAGTVIDGQVTDIAAATLHLRHCIVGSSFTDWSAALDFTPISVTPGVNADVTFCDVIGGFNGEGNLSAYPQFTGIYPLRLAQVQQRDRWESGPEVFQLRTISPCVDAGVATKVIASDFFGQLRPSGAAPDLGFHELRDADTDGADDWWEEQHGLDPADPLDGLDDGDGDTFPAAVEYDIGSDPGDPLDPRVDVYVSVDGDDNAGDGTPENPWRTIGRAQSLEYATRPLYFPRLRVHVGAGVFEEKIETITNTEIVGAGAGQTILQYYNAFEEDQNHVVLRLDADTAVRDCTITLPEEATPEDFVILVRIENVAAEISNVVLDGRGRAGTFGVFISGLGSSASVVRDSSLLNLQTGIQTINTAANITRNFFDGITGVALFVDRPDEKQDGAETTPLVGDFDTAETSGFNSFRDVSGLYVQNNNPDETLAEINDWGVYTEEEIAAKIAGSGAVDFVPFIGKSILSSTLVAGVFDALTEAPIPVERNPVAALDAAQDGSYDPASELHLFPTLVEGNYELTATATGYEPGVLEVEVSGGSIQYAALYLAPTPPSAVDAAETLLAAFAAADTDSSGGLSKAEAQAQIPELNDALFTQLDRDGNGEITQQELEAALPPSPGGCNCDKSTTTFDPRAFLENLFLFGLAAGVLFVLGRRA